MARQKKDSVVANVRLTTEVVIDGNTGVPDTVIDVYRVVTVGRLYRIEHKSGGAIPPELYGQFTDHYRASVAIARYLKRAGRAHEVHTNNNSPEKPDSRDGT